MVVEPSSQDDTILSSDQLDRLNGEKLKQIAPHPTDDELRRKVSKLMLPEDDGSYTLIADETVEDIMQIVLPLLSERERLAVALNRKELAQDIKRRHWVNDNLRDAYLDAVIAVADEDIASLEASKPEEKEQV